MSNPLNLSENTLSKIDEVVPKYPEKRSAALMVIHLVQDELGAVNDFACEWIANRLDLQPINIKELVTFYPMLREKPWGRKHVRVCRTLPCAYVDPMQPVNLLRKNWVLRKDMSVKMVNTRLSLWNALLTAGKDQWL